MRSSQITHTRYSRAICLLALCVATVSFSLAGCSGKNAPFAKNKKIDPRTARLAMPPEWTLGATRKPVRTIPVSTQHAQAHTPQARMTPALRPQTASLSPGRPAAINPRAQHRPRLPAAHNLQTASISKQQARKPMVVLKPIKGASSAANHVFMRALHRQLTGAGFAVTELPKQNMLSVTGTAQLGAMRGKQQAVTLSWQVYDTKGVRIGSVIQNNHIPRATFATTWGGNARHAAYAAAPGIVKLLHQARP